LNIEKEILEDRQAKLTVTYTNDEFNGFKQRGARKISKSTKIPGFRPGKAPYNVILTHYGEEAIIQEAIDILLESDYPKLLEEAEIEPSGSGSLEDIVSTDPPKFVFLVPLEPIVELGEYREIRKAYEPEPFDETEVDKYISNLRRNSATIVPSDKPAKEGDLVYFNLSGELLNPGEDEDPVITERTTQQVVIPTEDEVSDSEWPYPGFARELLGVNSGDVKEIQHIFPEDYDDEELRGKTALFTAEIHSIKELELPELDVDFISSVGKFETVDEFRKAVHDRLETDHLNHYEEHYFDDLINEVVENAEISYPPQMLKHEEEHALDDFKLRLRKQNIDFPTFLKLRNTDETTFYEEEVQPTAKARLERSLVVSTLIESENLKLNQELLNTHINEIVQEFVDSGNVEQMKKAIGTDEFSRALSREGVNRTINAQLFERLKLIATGQPIPDDEELEEEEEVSEKTGSEGEQAMETSAPENNPIETETEALISEDTEDSEDLADLESEADKEESEVDDQD
jgi:trigger factor